MFSRREKTNDVLRLRSNGASVSHNDLSGKLETAADPPGNDTGKNVCGELEVSKRSKNVLKRSLALDGLIMSKFI